MTMINKEKVLKGVGKAVDAANNAADKAAAFAKEKELDDERRKQEELERYKEAWRKRIAQFESRE